MGKIYSSISELAGHTPLLELKGYERELKLQARILAKLEFYNPNQNVKDRIAVHMIEEAERSGRLKKGDTIVDTTSGNTGIGLAAVAASKGYRCRIYMQAGVSSERTKSIEVFGGEVVDQGSIPEVVEAVAAAQGDYFAGVKALVEKVLVKEEHLVFLNQSGNPDNPRTHELTTGPEIWEDTDGEVDYFVAGVGTGGTITGVGRFLKEKKPEIKIIGVQPGPRETEGQPMPKAEEITGIHKYAGVPKEWVPKVLDTSVIDERMDISEEDSVRTARRLALTDGICVGKSSGTALYAATLLAARPENRGKTFVVLLPDSGLRYFSDGLFA